MSCGCGLDRWGHGTSVPAGLDLYIASGCDIDRVWSIPVGVWSGMVLVSLQDWIPTSVLGRGEGSAYI